MKLTFFLFAGAVLLGSFVQVSEAQTSSSTPPVGMALVPAGAFTMGDTLDGESDAIPTVTATLSAFYMDTNLVSLSQWQTVYNWAIANGYDFDDAGNGKAANHPVYNVNWYDAVKWSNARSQQGGLTPVYYTDAAFTQVYASGDVDAVYANWSASGFRLPTEAEWEKAARGGLIGQRFPWGDTISESQANYYGETGGYSYDMGPNGYNASFDFGGAQYWPFTSPVGSFAANGYGLYDMAGNLDEWCWDWYATPYAGGSDPRGPASSPSGGRVERGGNWEWDASNATCANRYKNTPNDINPQSGANYGMEAGFRCVSSIPPVLGVDVSANNSPNAATRSAIQWQKVALENISFAYVRATLGASPIFGGSKGTYVDLDLDYNVTQAKINHVAAGVYHVAFPENNGALNEALTFFAYAGKYVGDGFLPPMLDIENDTANAYAQAHGGAALSEWVSSWLQYVSQLTGVAPGVYTSASSVYSYFENLPTEYGLMIADYNSDQFEPPSYMGETLDNWLFHQWTDDGEYDAIPAASPGVDSDTFNGNSTQLLALTVHSSTPVAINPAAILGPNVGPIVAPQAGQFQMTIYAPGQQQVVIQSSVDLSNWNDVSTVPLVNGFGTFTDTSAGAKSVSFYRIKP